MRHFIIFNIWLLNANFFTSNAVLFANILTIFFLKKTSVIYPLFCAFPLQFFSSLQNLHFQPLTQILQIVRIWQVAYLIFSQTNYTPFSGHNSGFSLYLLLYHNWLTSHRVDGHSGHFLAHNFSILHCVPTYAKKWLLSSTFLIHICNLYCILYINWIVYYIVKYK